VPERLLLFVIVAALVVAAAIAVRAWNTRRQQAIQQQLPDWLVLGQQPDGRRTLIAFSTPSCAACLQAQAPAIDLAQKRLGPDDIRVIHVDAAEQPEAARAFGILTVPSTVVLAATGNAIVAINQGFAPSARLIEQLQRA
jgi:thiol-disulfide isomerase/thioredoxin